VLGARSGAEGRSVKGEVHKLKDPEKKDYPAQIALDGGREKGGIPQRKMNKRRQRRKKKKLRKRKQIWKPLIVGQRIRYAH